MRRRPSVACARAERKQVAGARDAGSLALHGLIHLVQLQVPTASHSPRPDRRSLDFWFSSRRRLPRAGSSPGPHSGFTRSLDSHRATASGNGFRPQAGLHFKLPCTASLRVASFGFARPAARSADRLHSPCSGHAHWQASLASPELRPGQAAGPAAASPAAGRPWPCRFIQARLLVGH